MPSTTRFGCWQIFSLHFLLDPIFLGWSLGKHCCGQEGTDKEALQVGRKRGWIVLPKKQGNTYMFKEFLLTPLICCSLIGLACDFEKRRKVGLGYLVVLSYPGICTGASRSKTQGQCCIHVWSNISTRWRVGFYIVRFPNPLAFGLGLTWRGKKEFKYDQSVDSNLLQDGNMIGNHQPHCLQR